VSNLSYLQVEDDEEARDSGYEVNEDDTVEVKHDDFLKVMLFILLRIWQEID